MWGHLAAWGVVAAVLVGLIPLSLAVVSAPAAALVGRGWARVGEGSVRGRRLGPLRRRRRCDYNPQPGRLLRPPKRERPFGRPDVCMRPPRPGPERADACIRLASRMDAHVSEDEVG